MQAYNLTVLNAVFKLTILYININISSFYIASPMLNDTETPPIGEKKFQFVSHIPKSY